jgi:hypothetical protein
MTVIEALSVGLPIIFPFGLSLGELIATFGAGNAYSLDDPRSLEVSLFNISNPETHDQYQRASRELFSAEFSVGGWYQKLLDIHAAM